MCEPKGRDTNNVMRGSQSVETVSPCLSWAVPRRSERSRLGYWLLAINCWLQAHSRRDHGKPPLQEHQEMKNPQTPTNLRQYFTITSARSIFSFTPMRSKVRRLPGKRDSPILKRGNFSLSKIATFHPCLASKVPAVLPAGPPPTIKTSKNSAILSGKSCVSETHLTNVSGRKWDL